ncbi:MAG TPA: undecaprenyl-diphosphate phosphatase [Candidatus Sulfotelmatobacter sp.]|nr:undecaprenyl-diphosphate phosphatase [Candidatus Sulfotelmatobacter sp.]
MLSYLQAVVLGLLQGVTELFPISSLGHSVIVPQLLGWTDVVAAQSASESYFLAFLVGLHVATALALVVFYRDTWARIVVAVLGSLRSRRIATADARLGWLLIVATIPAGLAGVLFEHVLRVLFAVPLAAAGFLIVNGLILLAGEVVRRRAAVRAVARVHGATASGDRRLDTLEFREAGVIGVAQVLALFAGISRSGITMVAGLVRGLDHEDAARFSFLLATPVILAAGVYKLPDLLGPNGDGVQGQILAGSIAAALAAYASVRFLSRYFTTRTLLPFAAYCLIAGLLAVLRFA